MTELERQKEELANLQHAKEVTEHRINRNENRIRSALKNRIRQERIVSSWKELSSNTFSKASRIYLRTHSGLL